MNHRTRQAVLRILMLTEEFSCEELAEAVTFLGGQKEEGIFAFLKSMAPSQKRPSTPRSAGAGLNAKGETRALQELKSVDGAKYQVLREFERAIREGRVLKTLDDFRAFGTILGKDFTPGKSRKEALGRLMAVLARMDLESIRAAIAKAPARSGEETAFRRLANQIISGPRNQAADA
jgi:hypothetical protein